MKKICKLLVFLLLSIEAYVFLNAITVKTQAIALIENGENNSSAQQSKKLNQHVLPTVELASN